MPRTKQFDEQEVLTRAMDLFWRQGYTATSVQDLVDHLGINRASMYDTFGGKETLFKKALEQYRKINREGVRQFFQSHPDVKAGLRQLFEKAIDDSVTDNYRKGCFVVNTTTELIPGDDQILNVLEENKKEFEHIFFEYLKKGEKEGQFETDQNLKSVASLLFTLYNGIKVIAKIQPNRTELMNSVEIVLSLLR